MKKIRTIVRAAILAVLSFLLVSGINACHKWEYDNCIAKGGHKCESIRTEKIGYHH